MKTSLPQHIREFAEVAANRLVRVGGPQAALLAEAQPQPRTEAQQALNDLGADELDVRHDADDLLAAAVLCRAAGAAALPYPVVEDLLAVDGARLVLVDPRAARINHGDLPGDWLAADLDGRGYRVQLGDRPRAKLGPFLVPATLRERDAAIAAADIDLHLVLGSWLMLGAAERCCQIAVEHVGARTQFRRPLSEFQAVRFTVADVTVAVRGLAELAKYTLSRTASLAPAPRRADALMLRAKAIDTTLAAFRAAHQLLGALGFCDESDVSVIDRHTQPLLRLPAGAEELTLRLLPALRDGQLETLFSRSVSAPAPVSQ